MAFYDIVHNWAMTLPSESGTVRDIVSRSAEMFFPLIVPLGWSGAFPVVGSPIIKTIKVWR